MFHLFNKVYLNFDHNIVHNENRIVISSEVGQPFSTEFAESTESMEPGTSFYQFLDVQDFKNENIKDELEFFKKCKYIYDNNNSRTLQIYCDRKSFVHLFIAWHKIIMKNVTCSNLWKIFSFYIEKESYLSALSFSNFRVFYEVLKIENWDKTEFENLFDNISVDRDTIFVGKLMTELGIEYVLSSYLTGNQKFKSILKNKLLNLIKRNVQSELYELKLNLILSYQNKAFHNFLNVEGFDSMSDMFNHERIKIFKDPDMWSENAILLPSSRDSAINFNSMTSENVERIIEDYKFLGSHLLSLYGNSIKPFKIEWLRFIVNDEIDDAELMQILNDDRCCASEISDFYHNRKINVNFIDWILNLHRVNKKENILDLNVSI